MGLSFLAPLFLAGAAAVAIPVIIHLTHKERRDAVPFPSLMFLRRIPHRTVRRRTIRNWFLFLLRSAVPVVLAVAFARPLLDRPTAAAPAVAGPREVVVLVDRSYSMGYAERWSEALGAARRVVDRSGPEDRTTVAFFSDQARVAARRTGDRTILREALDGAALGSGGTRYTPALQLARKLLEESGLPRREVLLISDFQRVGWREREPLELPKGSVLSYVDVSREDPANISFTGVSFQRVPGEDRDELSVAARLAGTGEERFAGLPVTLEIDGQEVGSTTVDVEAGSSGSVELAPVPLPRREVRAVVRVEGDELSEDNAFHFTVASAASLPVLVVSGSGLPDAEALYLRRALEIGRDPMFAADFVPLSRLGERDLERYRAVIWNDAPLPTGRPGRRLAEFVEGGGGLLIALGRRSGGDAPEGGSLSPGSPATRVDRSTEDGGTLSFLDYEHPVFELFRAPRSGDFARARFFRYWRMEDDDSASVLARFDDGSAALLERSLGHGRILTWTSGLANAWNDLVVQPVFLPFLHRATTHVARHVKEPAWFTVGEVVTVEELSRGRGGAVAVDPEETTAEPGEPGIRRGDVPPFPGGILTGDAEVRVAAPSGEERRLRPGEDSPYLVLAEQGFYGLRVGERSGAPRFVAVNPPPREADLTSLDPEELVSAVSIREGESVAAEESWTPAERERRQGLWWFLLVGALGLLVTETVVANRLPGPTT